MVDFFTMKIHTEGTYIMNKFASTFIVPDASNAFPLLRLMEVFAHAKSKVEWTVDQLRRVTVRASPNPKCHYHTFGHPSKNQDSVWLMDSGLENLVVDGSDTRPKCISQRPTMTRTLLIPTHTRGELIHRQANLGYGTYSIEMIASDIVGQVTSFFLIANEDTEIDIELTGLNNKVGWMNVWHDHKQDPELPFDTSKGWHSYMFDWFEDRIVWYVDGQMVLNRSDIQTTPPDKVNYKLAINSWTQVQPEVNIDWTGKFKYPKDGRIPEAQFRNMKYVPRIDGTRDKQGDGGHPDITNPVVRKSMPRCQRAQLGC